MIDLRLAFRSLVRTPLVTGIAILSLGLGIGANAAIFSLFDRLALQTLSVRQPGRLVNLSSPGPKQGSTSSGTAGGPEAVFSYPMLRDLQREQTPFVGIAGHRLFGANLSTDNGPIRADGLFVTGNYFELLGLQPAAGRLLSAGDDVTPGAHPVVVLSYDCWRRQFDGSDSAIGNTLDVNGQPMTVIGVAPRGFRGTTVGQSPGLFASLSMHDVLVPRFESLKDRRSYWVYAFARLEEGTTLAQAQTAINVPYSAILREVELPLQEGMSEQDQALFAAKRVVLEPGRRGQSRVFQNAKAPLFLLLAVTALVLLLACANIANLLLNKALGRSGEIAVRLSLGARRRQLVAQLLTESFLLAACGGLVGWWMAQGTLRFIVFLLPDGLASRLGVSVGPTTWLFLAALSLIAGLLGLFPALNATRTELSSALKAQSGRDLRSQGAQRFRTGMAVVQIGLSTALLISAGMFLTSLHNLSHVDLGIEVEQLATFGIAPETNGYSPERSRALFEQLERELSTLPGAVEVSASTVPIIAGSSWSSDVYVEGFSSGRASDHIANRNAIGPGYFATLSVPLLAGRTFDERDTAGAPRVAIVNQAFARQFHLGEGPEVLGKRLTDRGSDADLDIEIVGLVADSTYSDVKRKPPALLFTPYLQASALGWLHFYVRSQSEPEALLHDVREVATRLAPDLPVEGLMTMTAQVQQNVSLDRTLTILSSSFATLATLLAAIGLYGVVAFRVGQRTREIGLRMALGADGRRVRGLVLRHVLWMTLPGVVLGAFAAFGLGRLARSLLFEMQGREPGIFALAAALLTIIALVAGAIPAERAARIDPILALRDE